MPPVRLTPQVLRTLPAIEGRRTDYFDQLRRGLVLRVSPTARSWAVTWKRRGRQERVTLGELELLTLAQARERARKILGRVAQGEDPAAERREAARRAQTAPDVFHHRGSLVQGPGAHQGASEEVLRSVAFAPVSVRELGWGRGRDQMSTCFRAHSTLMPRYRTIFWMWPNSMSLYFGNDG